ncbi:GGDEF domain-containing protein [Paramagnetospirillum kuznetsovii]|uniref:diguanylate cyclase n=1 Tax=Paramagnetospirillum kuznetsovii TaxID=2053833 RepID=A0A364P0Y7_9PROT|nr:GGDEF domain-containing protein [Paramagnetospirillum kuznetsovii]RAU22966.1 GGDEF domain-containing protein [Paramagnetospirillum kuznetsovii]
MELKRVVFGNATFREGDEYHQFQYRFTCAVLVFAITITALFQLAVLAGPPLYDPIYVMVGRGFLAVSVAAFLILRGHPERMRLVAPAYAVLALAQYVMVLLFNGPDELRAIWFALNLPGVYLILGSRIGIAITAASIAIVIVANPHLPTPYSPGALITVVLGMVYISAFFHAYAARSISFHHAMVEANRKLAHMAARDPLTGLLNARAYYGLCEGALSQARRTGSPFAMLFVDLDHFKSVNDRFGHDAGDTVLRAAALCLEQGIRQSDLVGRIGGEEFCVLLPDTVREGARLLAEKLRADIEALMPDIGSERLRVTASIGVAVADAEVATIAEVQRLADDAMYRAKRQGRNRVTCFDELDSAAVPGIKQSA